MQASEWLSGRSSVRLCAGLRVLQDGQCVVRNVQSGPEPVKRIQKAVNLRDPNLLYYYSPGDQRLSLLAAY